MPICWIIAGPNGAGKTTFALEYLPKISEGIQFINADLIAAGLSPLMPQKQLISASRIFLKQIETCIKNHDSFAFETTLAGRSYLRLIERLQAQGWQVELIYLALPNVEMSKLRVAERVAHGGHAIPLVDINRRFSRSLFNLFSTFSYRVDGCSCFMNEAEQPQIVFEQTGMDRKITNQYYFDFLLKKAGL